MEEWELGWELRLLFKSGETRLECALEDTLREGNSNEQSLGEGQAPCKARTQEPASTHSKGNFILDVCYNGHMWSEPQN